MEEGRGHLRAYSRELGQDALIVWRSYEHNRVLGMVARMEPGSLTHTTWEGITISVGDSMAMRKGGQCSHFQSVMKPNRDACPYMGFAACIYMYPNV